MTLSNSTTLDLVAHFEDGSAFIAGECVICEYAERRGEWDSLLNHGRRSARTHCGDCHRTYRRCEAHCSRCHLTFSSSKTFEYHSRLDHCDDPTTRFRADGNPFYVATERDDGIVFSRWDSRVPLSQRNRTTSAGQLAILTAGSRRRQPTRRRAS